MNTHIELVHSIAEKPLSHNPDINQHIVSCRLSLAIINKQNTVIQALAGKINVGNNKIIKIIAELFNT